MEIEYNNSIDRIEGSLLFLKGIKNPIYGEEVEIELEDKIINGQVLYAGEDYTIVQVFGNSIGLNKNARLKFKGETYKINVSLDMIGRIFDGLGRPRDNGYNIYGEKFDINGYPINPYSRREPDEFIQTGISAIDVMNTLVAGQKLPIFSGAGLPHNKLAVQIARQAKFLDKNDDIYIVFAGMGITTDDANFFINEFKKSGLMKKSILFINLASDPAMERIILPRIALTASEYLAFENDYNVITILLDMTNYAEALKEISAARNEVPGRRGYPAYLYTDLATIYERAGVIKNKKGSLTLIPILTMPNDDITHPIPDLTGYITEGQITINRELNNKGLYPGIDILLSLSRLMNNGIGKDKTREDHRDVANQLYASYSKGLDARNLSKIVGEDALSDIDKKYLKFSSEFENKFLNQGYYEDRDIDKSLNLAWELLYILDKTEMKRIKAEYINKYGKWK